MRISIFIGFLLALFSIFYSLYLFILYLFFNLRLENAGIMTLLIALFFFSGVILLFLGMLGEYVSAIHSQVRKGPLVFERELINLSQYEQSGELWALCLTSNINSIASSVSGGECVCVCVTMHNLELEMPVI